MYNAELLGNHSESYPATVADLLAKIRADRLALEALIDQLSETQLLTPAADTGWSVKDQMAHIAIWESGIDGLLQGRSRFGTMGLDEADVATHNTDGLNDILIERSRQQSLAEVITFFNDSHRQLVATLGHLSDEDLLKPYGHYQPDQSGDYTDRPVIHWIAGNTYEHYAEHYPLIEKQLA
ncbi:MAG: ClbS/DfsB family four-helix bundle protein [Anaerolineaceae bacterium]|nr:ClbS/DfsB family four-helix bundle protein [Anaerolineaceae bacterium]MCB9102077.1 ClbS/DfsB family four-helix bundle protein [Anaerolineales bacterium]